LMVDRYYNSADFLLMALKGIVFPSTLIYMVGWIYGILFYNFVFQSYYLFMKNVRKMDKLSALDEFFLLDNPKNRANVITVVKLDRITDYAKFRQRVIHLATINPRLAHKLTKFGGEYFFEALNKPDLDKAIEERFVKNDTLKTDDDIAQFLAKE